MDVEEQQLVVIKVEILADVLGSSASRQSARRLTLSVTLAGVVLRPVYNSRSRRSSPI
jgi:hypothetical protein